MVGVLGVDPSRLQLSAAPAYKAEPHAGADAGNGQGGRLRSDGLALPKRALYQAELHPEGNGAP
jgi:hypothetical protein